MLVRRFPPRLRHVGAGGAERGPVQLHALHLQTEPGGALHPQSTQLQAIQFAAIAVTVDTDRSLEVFSRSITRTCAFVVGCSWAFSNRKRNTLARLF